MLTLDNRGVGQSDCPQRRSAYSTDRMAEDVSAVMVSPEHAVLQSDMQLLGLSSLRLDGAAHDTTCRLQQIDLLRSQRTFSVLGCAGPPAVARRTHRRS